MLALLNKPPDNRFLSQLRREALGVVLGLLLIVVVLAALRTGLVLVWTTVGGALLIGLAIGICVKQFIALEHWPIIASCLDRAKIEERLRELDA
jgi:hypothetical protein